MIIMEILLYEFQLSHSAKEAFENICKTKGVDAIKLRNAYLWLKISVLPLPAYSPDLAPSDYYLFRSMAHFLRGRCFQSAEQLKNGGEEFFASNEPEWY